MAMANGNLNSVKIQRIDDRLDTLANHRAGRLIHPDGVGLQKDKVFYRAQNAF